MVLIAFSLSYYDDISYRSGVGLGLLYLFALIIIIIIVLSHNNNTKSKEKNYYQKLNIVEPADVRREVIRLKSYAETVTFKTSEYIIEKLINEPDMFEDVIMRANECKRQYDYYCENNGSQKSHLDINSTYVLVIDLEWVNRHSEVEKKSHRYTWQMFLDLVDISDDISWEEYKEIKSSLPEIDVSYSQKYRQTKTYNKSYSYEDKKAFAARERGKMSNKMRYKILNRDGFKCVICGRTAEDGIKLHVDHIKPVSKGGMTIESNLRTLCNECNLGKGAKYDPNGLN